MGKRTIEIANTVFERVNDGDYIVKKTRFGDLVLEGKYSLDFVNQYARLNEDTVIDAYGKASFTEGLPKMKSSQQIRDEIVERAKADVEELLSRNYDSGSTARISRAAETVWFSNKDGANITDACEFIVNKEKRTVVSLIKTIDDGKLVHKGIAKCAPTDCFNAHIGKAIALRRALGLDVPSEYYNAPKPTEVRVGDVVDWHGQNVYEIIGVKDGNYRFKDVSDGWISEYLTYSKETLTSKICDDSRE